MTNDDDDAGIDIFNDDHGHYPCCVIVFSRQWRQPQILSSCGAGIARRKKSNRRAYRDQGAAKGRMSGDKTGGLGRRRLVEDVGKERRRRTRRTKREEEQQETRRGKRNEPIKSKNSFRKVQFASK